ncbi:YgiQ family radical SAM protein [Eubacteriales bacterium OttesenSCG-928-A19]|nr:YgiQ family radical SAM protein [Eubacteriales bacterium OttesenSCG-928-A19]
MQQTFLPISAEEMRARGWDTPDFVFVTGDAYVDHPSFGCAILTRVLEAEGYRVAVLAQPGWRNCQDFTRFGRPRLGFLVSAGVIDSMVNHYTVAKKPRGEDVYTPGGKRGQRPDRATIVYCNRIREAYADIPILIGGVEASLRRFAHYDYWDDRVRHSILTDSGADLLLYGMGEETLVQAARMIRAGRLVQDAHKLRGACWTSSTQPDGYEVIPSFQEASTDGKAYARAFLRQYQEQDPIRGKPLAQQDGGRWICQNTPALPLSRQAMDQVYALPFTRQWHPSYDAQGGVPALEEVKFSITGTRGCFGGCSFCALTFHQGRIVTSRSPDSIVREAEEISCLPDFKGYIHDIGGPTADFRKPACGKQRTEGTCAGRQCLYPRPCKHLRADHAEFLQILRRVRTLPGIKKVFIRSGLRYDYILEDKHSPFLKELCAHHVSGRLKVAPEHVSSRVLDMMGKPPREVFDRFVQKFDAINQQLGMRQYVQPYLMSSHPGSDMLAAVELAEYLRDTRQQPEQVQDFYPTPGTLSTCMYYTGLDPRTMRPVHVPTSPHEKAMQRALMQFRRPQNRALVREALKLAGREDLIGYSRECLVPPASTAKPKNREKKEECPRTPAKKARTSGRPPRKPEEGRLGTRSPRAALKKGKKP